MGKAADDKDWLDDLAAARDAEADDGGDHPVDAVDITGGDQAAAPAPEPKADEPKADDQGKTVPVAVLTEERNKFQAQLGTANQQIQNLNAQVQKFSGLADEIKALKEAKDAKPEEPAPDYLEDPKGYIDHTAKSTLDQLRGIQETIEQTTEAQGAQGQELNQQRQVQAIQQMASAGEEAYAKGQPDYWDALEHLRNVRANQLQMAFPDATPQQLAEHMRAEEFSTAAQILQQGRNPAEYAYQFAKTLGYTPAQQPKGAGKTNEPDDPEALDEARQNAQGLGSSGSGGDLNQLMELDGDEFDQAMKETFG